MWWETVAAVIGLLLALYGAAELCLCAVQRLVLGKATYPLICITREEGRLRQLRLWMHQAPCGAFCPTVWCAPHDEQTRRLCEELSIPVVTEKEWQEICKIALQDGESTL